MKVVEEVSGFSRLCDFKLKVEGKEVGVHKIIISRSPKLLSCLENEEVKWSLGTFWALMKVIEYSWKFHQMILFKYLITDERPTDPKIVEELREIGNTLKLGDDWGVIGMR